MSLLLTGLLVLVTALALYASKQIRATAEEKARTLPGDDLIPHPLGSLDHAITVRRPPHEVWPWLAQMGSGRAGWYAYDFVDNGGHLSAERILPEYQEISVGTVFPALPEATDVFVVAQYEKDHSLVLGWKLPDGKYQTTWAFILEEPQLDQTRLIVRGRVAPGYRPYGLPQWLAVLTGRPAHFIISESNCWESLVAQSAPSRKRPQFRKPRLPERRSRNGQHADNNPRGTSRNTQRDGEPIRIVALRSSCLGASPIVGAC